MCIMKTSALCELFSTGRVQANTKRIIVLTSLDSTACFIGLTALLNVSIESVLVWPSGMAVMSCNTRSAACEKHQLVASQALRIFCSTKLDTVYQSHTSCCTDPQVVFANQPDELLEHLSCLLLRTLRPVQSLQTSCPTGNKADGTDIYTTKQLLDSLCLPSR